MLNSKTIDDSLKQTLNDCVYIKYGIEHSNKKSETKREIIDQLNDGQEEKVKYHICKISDLTEDLLIKLFYELSPNYEIDGVVIEINNISIQEKLGRETSSGNPAFSRAFKHSSFEQSAETEILGISWQISKNSLLKPILHINPVKLDGVTISNVTGNNAKFVKYMGLGIGAVVKIIRSGMVIPKIVDVIKPVEFKLPIIDGVEIGWNSNGIELMALSETDEQKIKKIISFFEILEADNIGEGVIHQLWNAGFKTIKDILELTPDKLNKLNGFGERKSTIVINSIKKCTNNISLSKLMHATGIFVGLGSRKLVLLEHFVKKPTIEEVMAIEGFAEISSLAYLEGYNKFFDFIKDLPITINKKIEVGTLFNGDLSGTNFVFTGIRDKTSEEILIERGAKIGSSVSKNTTHLVMKSIGSGSAKEKKAIELGIKILTIEDLYRQIIN